MMPPSDQAALERIRQAAEQLQRLAEQQTYEYLAAPFFGPRPGNDQQYERGVLRITRATGAVAVLEERDGRFAWRPLPMVSNT